MQFSFSILSLTALALTVVQAAPSPNTSLTKRWCGFEHNCPCHYNIEKGCAPTFDECAGQWYWPPSCTGCAPCLELCFDPLVCVSDAV
ncbi:hypothetical protein B0H13DRAFT_2340636 [Mycena leptocephala]|nr:hypothetical protein B0H13DRAFT_2340636 [Mycena leptocephala]